MASCLMGKRTNLFGFSLRIGSVICEFDIVNNFSLDLNLEISKNLNIVNKIDFFNFLNVYKLIQKKSKYARTN